nr:MAG TPA: Protein of unknown function (DUF2778) [Caudoviricetes sp.]
MNIYIRRNAKRDTYTIGALEIAGKRICDTLEDKDRGLTDRQPEDVIKRIKVHGETAIPTGTYRVDMDSVSPRFGSVAFYKQVCGGKLPRLVGVKGFAGVLIHAGNTAQDTHGCILVGENKQVGTVLNSRDTFEHLYKLMAQARAKGEEITITIC